MKPIGSPFRIIHVYLYLIFLLSGSHLVYAQADITGSWRGDLDLGFQKLPLVFHFEKNGEEWAGKMDSPSQGAMGISISKTLFDGHLLLLQMSQLQASFEGILKDGEIQGQFTQSGLNLPLTLQRRGEQMAKAVERLRPQEPHAPFPYQTLEISLVSGPEKTLLRGTITRPLGEGPFPAVVLVSGSGPQNRDGEILGHKPLWVIADYLTRQGIVVVRYDERGVGQSEGTFEGTTSEGFAKDARAVMERLPYYEFVDKSRIGVIGHSEGGLIAWLLGAQQDALPAFIVALAPPVVPIAELMEQQTEDIVRATGAPEEIVLGQRAVNGRLYQALTKAKDLTEAENNLRQTLRQLAQENGVEDAALEKTVTEQVDSYQQMLEPWFFSFIRTDPGSLIRQINVPIWAAFGEKDVQVNANANRTKLESLIENQAQLEVTVYPGLNHLFQRSSTGAVSEYGEIEETFNEDVLEDIAEWINERAR